jgi:serine/threonine-protein kinase
MVTVRDEGGDDRFQVLDTVGSGGLSVVHRVISLRAGGVEGALKLVDPAGEEAEELRRDFLDEVRGAGPVRHHHLARIYDAGTTVDGAVWVLTEYVNGPDLAAYVSDRGYLPAAEVLERGAEILHALAVCHDHRLVHRNLHPRNVVLRSRHDGTREAVLTDPGLARCGYRHRAPSAADYDFRTRSGVLFADPQYAAPECRDLTAWDVPADLFAVGLLVHVMLVGEHPVPDPQNWEGWLLRAANDPERADSVPVSPKLPADWRRFFARALAADPSRRFGSATEMRESLEALGTGGGWQRELVRSRGARVARAIGTGLVSLMVVGALGVGAWFLWQRQAEREIEVRRVDATPQPGMAFYPSARVTLGADEPEGFELPAQKVGVPAFFLDLHEVTRGDYYATFSADPGRWPPSWGGTPPLPEARALPVTDVTWTDAVAYANRVGKRLPTAAEFERAARAGGGLYPWGREYDPDRLDSCLDPTGRAGPCPVGEDAVPSGDRNQEGVTGLAGNVSEWTSSPWASAPSGPLGRVRTFEEYRTVKGGNWSRASETAVRATTRTRLGVEERSPLVGFRCARDARPQPVERTPS